MDGHIVQKVMIVVLVILLVVLIIIGIWAVTHKDHDDNTYTEDQARFWDGEYDWCDQSIPDVHAMIRTEDAAQNKIEEGKREETEQ